MPQKSDTLADYLGADYRRTLRAVLFEYEVSMVSSLYWQNAAPWKLASRKCPDTFFLVPVEGNVRVVLSGQTTILRPGTFLMLPENVRHSLELLPGCRTLRQFAIHCHIHDRWGRPLLARFSSAIGRLTLRPFWIGAFRELTSLMATDPESGQQRGEMLIRELLLQQLSQDISFQPHPSASDARVGVVLHAMKQELSEPNLSIETLARRVNITPVQLRKLFRQETGVRPKEFLNSLRLREATRLLRHTNASVKEISSACGYSSDHYFHLVFRQEFGCTPSVYRRRSPLEV